MRIAILVEGPTEQAFMPTLRSFLEQRLNKRMPRLCPDVYDGRIPKGDELRRIVRNHLSGKNPSNAVIALTDVYTGSDDFQSAADAKSKMRAWVGNEERFYPHAAQHDFEAWLLPYWSTIKSLSGANRAAPAGQPENVNHNKPPAYHLKEVFRIGSRGRKYVKPRDAGRVLRGNDLAVAAAACPNLKELLNTILKLCGGQQI